MDSTEFAANLFSSFVPVTAAIYKNGKEKADVKWSFEISVSPSDSALANFKKRLYESYGIRERCLELQIENFVIKLQNIKHQGIPDASRERERMFSIDSQEQWKDVLDKLVKLERELVGKYFKYAYLL